MSSAPLSITGGHAETAASSSATGTAHDGSLVTVIEPRRGWGGFDLGEMWRYRELLFYLVWRDIKVQYKQTVLGPLWALVRPVVNLVIFSVVFGSLAKLPSQGVPYPIFVFAGMLPWMFFANAVNASSTSLLQHAGILSKVYFPRALLPMACLGTGAVNFSINCAIYACLMVYYAHLPGVAMLLLPLLVLLAAMTALGIGYFLAGLMVIYRDLKFVASSFVQALMYLTPVIYPVTLVPERYRWLLCLNPMTGIIDAFRSALLNQPVNYGSLGLSGLMAGVILLAGLCCFARTERRFADVA